MLPDFKFRGMPMTQDQTEKIVQLMFMKNNEKALEKDAELAELFLSKVLLKRIDAYQLNFTFSNYFFLASVLCGMNSPGKAMLVLAISFQYNKKYNKDLLTIEDWANIFPMGMPSEKEFNDMWLWVQNVPGFEYIFSRALRR